MRTAVNRNHALPSLALTGVVEDRYRSGSLHDSPVAAEIRQHGAHAALCHAAILGAVVSVRATGVVEGGRFGPPRRNWTVLSSGAGGIFLLARLGRLQEREPVLAFRLIPPGRLGRQGRNVPVGGIDDQRCPFTGRPDRLEYGVVRARDVTLASTLDALIATWNRGPLGVECGSLFVGERLFVRELRRPLKRSLVRVRPDALQVGIAPCRSWRWAGSSALLDRAAAQPQNSAYGRHECDNHNHDEQSTPHVGPPA